MKNDFNSLIIIRDYGHIRVKLAELLQEKGITRNKLSTLIGVNYDVINRYYKANNITMVDIDLFARICYVLKCDITDLLEYVSS